MNKTQHVQKLKVSEAGHCTEEEGEEVEQKGIIFIKKKKINVKVKLAKPACTKRC